jgi:hypothetical protein
MTNHGAVRSTATNPANGQAVLSFSAPLSLKDVSSRSMYHSNGCWLALVNQPSAPEDLIWEGPRNRGTKKRKTLCLADHRTIQPNGPPLCPDDAFRRRQLPLGLSNSLDFAAHLRRDARCKLIRRLAQYLQHPGRQSVDAGDVLFPPVVLDPGFAFARSPILQGLTVFLEFVERHGIAA